LVLSAVHAADLAVATAIKEPVGEIAGTLVIAGGGKLPDAVRDRFLELAGGKNAKLVIIPTASATADNSDASSSLETWNKHDIASVALLHTRQREEADDPAFVKPLTEATGVWFGGGDQSQLTTAYRGTAVERELQNLLARGGVIGGTSAGAAVMSSLMIVGGNPAVEMGQGFGFLPGVVVDQHFLKRNRVNRLLGVLAKHPGYVGLGIDEATAVIVRGRRLSVVGESYALLCLSASATRPASVQVLKAGEQADLVALSRSAIARSQPPFPPAKPDTPHVAKGTLIIGGGGGMAEAIWKRFIDLAGGPEALIVVVPTASEDPVRAEPAEVRLLRRYGANNVKVLHTRSRAEANTAAFVAPLQEAKGVWFGGGRQWRFVDAYQGTATEKAFHEVLERGGVIGGSSAGASIQSEYMPRGDPLGNLNIIAEGYERGFGFLKGVAVDQHFFARKRLRDMTELMATYPQLLGIGIDEGTVIVVQGSIMEVVGRSKVAVYDRRKPVVPGANDYEELPAGTRYDLATRQRVENK
jgi:cyanophycinase